MNKVRLGDIAIQIRGVSYKPDDILSENDDNSIGILRANNIQEELDLSDIVYIRKDRVKDYQLLKKEDILICASSGSKNLVGKAVRIPYDLNLSFGAFCKVVRTKGTINSDYLSCFFQSDYYRNYISNIAEGANINNIKNEHIDNLLLNTPNESNQLFYSKILLSLFSIIKAKKKQIEKLDELIKSRFVEMFGDPVTNSNNFIIRPLMELGELSRGVSKHRPRNDPKLLGGKYPLIQTGDVANADLYLSSYHYTYSELGLRQSKMWAKGTLCITIAANIAKTAILAFDSCFPDSVVAFNSGKETNNIFMHYWFSFFQLILERQAPESAQKNINLQILSELKVIVPPIKLQNQFADFVTQVEKQKATVQQSIDKLETLKKSLMQEYFG
ncbi:restriction endonuclease subunit S [uncultured Ruminococcus sp.]|uniref:restriction endonuclease subunit S n=1 Tax=uncultured Ruminococcus sp. TaxID=165186 RepID=UPI002931C09A|nr:restriction endonuclease subunit S [uncultured Ruminococcus sp.]